MATTKVTAKGPIEFTDNGKQVVIPLSAMSMDDSGKLTSTSAQYTGAKNKAAVDAWFKELVATGVVARAPEPPPVTAMVVTAAVAGSAGNGITVEFTNPVQDPNTKKWTFDLAVSEIDTYTGLSAGTIKTVIGTASGGGIRPGLVFVSSAGDATLPGPLVATGLSAGGTLVVNQKDGTTPAFTVQARTGVPDATKTTVQITAVDEAAKTFTLVATWPSPANKVTGKDTDYLKTQTDFTYLVTFAPGPTGEYLVPAAGKVQLRGGTDGASAKKASANVPAKA